MAIGRALLFALALLGAAFANNEGEAEGGATVMINGVPVYISGATTAPPTPSPVPYSVRKDAMIWYLASRFGDIALLEDADSPQGKAVQWLAETDPAELPVPPTMEYKDSFRFVQRYSLAVAFYAWGGWNTTEVPFLTGDNECNWNTGGESAVGAQCNHHNEVSSLNLRKYRWYTTAFIVLMA